MTKLLLAILFYALSITPLVSTVWLRKFCSDNRDFKEINEIRERNNKIMLGFMPSITFFCAKAVRTISCCAQLSYLLTTPKNHTALSHRRNLSNHQRPCRHQLMHEGHRIYEYSKFLLKMLVYYQCVEALYIYRIHL